MANNNKHAFQIADYAILIIVIAGSFSIGLYHAVFKRATSTEEYLMASRKLKIIPTAVSLLISYISAISVLGNATETYFYGFNFFFILISYIAGAILAAITFIPLLYPMKLTSVNEYLYLRYRSRAMVYAASILQVLNGVIYNAVVLYGPAVMLESMADVPVWLTLLGLGLLSTVYTSISGLKAVIWSDVFQCVVIFGGLLTIVIIGTAKVGGLGEVWSIYAEYERMQIIFDPLKRVSVTSIGLGITINMWCSFGMSQIAVQRYCALPSLLAAKRSLLSTIPVNLAIQSLTCFTGVVVFAYFAKLGCDPYTGGLIDSQNQILPHYIIEVLNYPCISGIFVASVLCGSLSNLSSSFSSSAALLWQDVLKNIFQNLTEERKAFVTKILALGAGVVTILSGFLVSTLGGTLLELTISLVSITFAPLISLIVSGMMTPRHNSKAACLGAISAFITTSFFSLGHIFFGGTAQIKPTVITSCNQLIATFSNITEMNVTTESVPYYNMTPLRDHTNEEEHLAPQVFRISYAWYNLLGLVTALTVIFMVSLIPFFQENSEDVRPEYIFPFMRYFFQINRRDYKAVEMEDLDNTAVGVVKQVSENESTAEELICVAQDKLGSVTENGNTQVSQELGYATGNGNTQSAEELSIVP